MCVSFLPYFLFVYCRPLLSNNDLSGKRVEELFEKTDAYIAQIRDNLSAESNTLHFVHARSPDTTFKVISSLRCCFLK